MLGSIVAVQRLCPRLGTPPLPLPFARGGEQRPVLAVESGAHHQCRPTKSTDKALTCSHETSTSGREPRVNEAIFTAATVRRGEWLSTRLSSDHRERTVNDLPLRTARRRPGSSFRDIPWLHHLFHPPPTVFWHPACRLLPSAHRSVAISMAIKKPGLKYAPTFDQGGEQLVPGSESLAWVMRIDQRSMAFYMATCAVHFAPTPATHFVWTFLAVTGLTGVGKIGLRALSPELTEMIRI